MDEFGDRATKRKSAEEYGAGFLAVLGARVASGGGKEGVVEDRGGFWQGVNIG